MAFESLINMVLTPEQRQAHQAAVNANSPAEKERRMQAQFAAQKEGALGAMKNQLANWQPVQQLQKEGFTPQTGPLKEFEGIKQGIQNRAQAAKQGNLEAMQRKFASSGNLNSGAAIKAQDVSAQQADQNTADQVAGVDLQAAQETQRRNEQGQEAANQRNLQRDLTNQSMQFNDKLQKFDAGSKLAQLDLGFEQFGLQKGESEFNKAAERNKAAHSGGLFGGGGFLGLGLDTNEVNF